MKKYVIIVAGGKGLRMGSDLPKQFLPMGDRPVLMHTLEVFRRYDETLQIIVVLPREQQDFWKQLCQKHSFAERQKNIPELFAGFRKYSIFALAIPKWCVSSAG